MVDELSARTYRSIFLEDDWAHRKYYGWNLFEDRPGLKVLQKRRAIFTRNLILMTREGHEMLADAVKQAAGKAGLAEVTIHDFDGVFENPPQIAGHRFRLMNQSERLLNIATLVIDLTRDEEAIFAAMSSDYRRKIRKAEASGVTVVADVRPDEEQRRAFLDVFESFSKERNLKPAERDVVGKMYDNGDAILFVVHKNGRIANYLHVYMAGDIAIFMHGVNLSKENDGAGQYLHWQAIRHLKSLGLGWYDLGGVAVFDPSDGIYNFKSKFGAKEIRLGSEWAYDAPLLRAAKALAGMRR